MKIEHSICIKIHKVISTTIQFVSLQVLGHWAELRQSDTDHLSATEDFS